jgi:hypothetical protein
MASPFIIGQAKSMTSVGSNKYDKNSDWRAAGVGIEFYKLFLLHHKSVVHKCDV